MDGTFDQRKPLYDLIERVRSNPDNKQMFSCFDLSAATDRLPIDIQVQILEILVGSIRSKI
jgi:hypothetical protein